MTGESKDSGGTINTGGGAYIGGRVKVGGDFVGRDKVVTAGAGGVAVGGNVTGGAIVTGSGNVISQPQGVTLDQFRALLTDIRSLIPQAGLDERKARLIEGDVATVEEETQQAKPDKSIIQSKLESTTQVLKAAGNLTEEGKKLLPLLSQGVLWIARLFI